MWYVAATAIMAFQRTGQWIDIWRFVAASVRRPVGHLDTTSSN